MPVTHHQVIQVKECLLGGFDLFALKAHHKRLTLQFLLPDGLPPLLIDAVSFVQVFHLLVDRALAVTSTGGVIVRAKRAAGGIMIRVEDEGPWVAPRDVPRLFVAPSPEADLVVAAQLARRLEGTLTAISGPKQKGLCVLLRIPMVPTLC
ncbi:MAG: HAMP domain-containing histidine kinase [Deltaproteobacteria bacterium]|nr:HAMP domain-containing histidine kinase [Deltaproteobacteria bacterium]